jgi:hypothetical protein
MGPGTYEPTSVIGNALSIRLAANLHSHDGKWRFPSDGRRVARRYPQLGSSKTEGQKRRSRPTVVESGYTGRERGCSRRSDVVELQSVGQPKISRFETGVKRYPSARRRQLSVCQVITSGERQDFPNRTGVRRYPSVNRRQPSVSQGITSSDCEAVPAVRTSSSFGP